MVMNSNYLAAAFRNLVNPKTSVCKLVISVSDSILTVPEDTAIFRISKCSILAWTVCGGDCWLQLSPGTTVYKIELIALFQFVTWISIDEGKTISTSSELLNTILTMPVLVTAETGK